MQKELKRKDLRKETQLRFPPPPLQVSISYILYPIYILSICMWKILFLNKHTKWEFVYSAVFTFSDCIRASGSSSCIRVNPMLSLLTIVQPWHFDGLSSCENPAQCDVTSLVHVAVLQRLYEDGWIQMFGRGEVERAWTRRRGGEESHSNTSRGVHFT